MIYEPKAVRISGVVSPPGHHDVVLLHIIIVFVGGASRRRIHGVEVTDGIRRFVMPTRWGANGPRPQLPVVETPIHRFVLTEITTHATAEVASRLHFRFKVLAAVAPNGVEEAITVWNLRRMKGLAETAANYLAQLVDEPNGRSEAPKLYR